MITLRLEGGDKLADGLRALSSRVNRQVQRDALAVGGEIIRAKASTNAPRAPGAPDLAANITMSTAKPDDGSVGVAIGPARGFFYGGFQEFGTVRHGAQPFLRPAFDSEGARALRAISSALWAALLRRGIGSTRGSSGGGGLL